MSRGDNYAFADDNAQSGLTIREYAAIAIMAGLVGNSGYDPVEASDNGHKKATAVAVKCADALIAALEAAP